MIKIEQTYVHQALEVDLLLYLLLVLLSLLLLEKLLLG